MELSCPVVELTDFLNPRLGQPEGIYERKYFGGEGCPDEIFALQGVAAKVAFIRWPALAIDDHKGATTLAWLKGQRHQHAIRGSCALAPTAEHKNDGAPSSRPKPAAHYRELRQKWPRFSEQFYPER